MSEIEFCPEGTEIAEKQGSTDCILSDGQTGIHTELGKHVNNCRECHKIADLARSDKPREQSTEDLVKDTQQLLTLTSLGLPAEHEFCTLLKDFDPKKWDDFIQQASVEQLSDTLANLALFYFKMRHAVEKFRKERGKQKVIEEIRERDRQKIAGAKSENKTKTKGRPAKIYDPDPALNKFIKTCVSQGMTEEVARTLFAMQPQSGD